MTLGKSTSPRRKQTAPARRGGAAHAVEDALASREAFLQSVLECSAVATLAVRHDGCLAYATPAARALFADLDTGGAAVKYATRQFHDPHFAEDLQAVLQRRGQSRREVQAVDGRWFLREIAPHASGPDGGGAVITFAGISDLKTAEQGIELARAYLDSILVTIRQPLVVLDPDWCVVSASGSFYSLFGVPPADLVGRRLTAAIGCLDVPAFRRFLQSIEQGGATLEDCEMDVEVPPLGRRTFAMSARVLREQSAAERKILMAIVDITQARHEGLEMQAARLEAERANLGKSKFLAAASHDLRQPLQTMSLIHGLLEKRAADEATRTLVRRLDETISTMSGMLDKLLDINQLETGTVRPEIRDFPIATLLDELRSEFLFHTATRQLDWRVIGSSLAVRSDPRLLEQVLRNLLSNAVKYTERGKILLGCRRQGDKVRIEIWDTGVGIPPSETASIFNEFHQLSNPARERARGLGLGLSIVHRLASLLEHRISVRSRVGHGSVFSVEVPLGINTSVPRAARRHPPQAKDASGALVLIVEDDPDLREMLQCLYESEGWRTMAHAEAASALRMLEALNDTPALVVADYNLPGGMSGVDLIARLQAKAPGSARAILLTGDISTRSLREIAHHDCIHVNKPVLAAELLRLSRTLVAQGAGKGQPIAPEESVAPACANPTICIIDDDAGLRELIREVLLEAHYDVMAFASGEAFFAHSSGPAPDCLVVDAVLPGLGGIEIIAQLRAKGSGIPAIVVTGHGAVPMAVAAMQAGAVDFIEKPVRADILIASVGRALSFARAPSEARAAATSKMSALTPRQRQIMGMILAGHPNKNIAADLAISQRTVENHRAAIMRKTNSESLPDLVRTALTSAGR